MQLDIGAGTVFFSLMFIRKMINGKVYACDIYDKILAWTRDNLPEKSKDIVVPLKMEENSVPLPGNIADLVYMINLHR